MRKTRSYASFGLRRLSASCTVSLSSGIRSSALQAVRVSHVSYPIQDLHCHLSATHWTCPYLNPSFRYPALSKYHLDSGSIHRRSHGRLMMKLVKEGVDMVVAE